MDFEVVARSDKMHRISYVYDASYISYRDMHDGLRGGSEEMMNETEREALAYIHAHTNSHTHMRLSLSLFSFCYVVIVSTSRWMRCKVTLEQGEGASRGQKGLMIGISMEVMPGDHKGVEGGPLSPFVKP